MSARAWGPSIKLFHNYFSSKLEKFEQMQNGNGMQQHQQHQDMTWMRRFQETKASLVNFEAKC